MAQDAAADNGKVRVGADKIVGELLYKIQQLAEGRILNPHGGVLLVEHNAMLIIVDIGAVLQAPCAIVNRNGNDTVIFPGGVIHPACVALILHAQQALGIATLGSIFCSCNGSGVLLRFAEVNGDVQITAGSRSNPLHILRDCVSADIVGILTELIVPIRCCFRTQTVIAVSKLPLNLTGSWSETAHQSGVEQLSGCSVILTYAPANRILRQYLQDFMELPAGNRLPIGIFVQLHHQQNLIASVDCIRRMDEFLRKTILHQLSDCFVYHKIPSLCQPDAAHRTNIHYMTGIFS